MRKLVRDSEGKVVVLISVNGKIPPGYTEVPSEELDAEELSLARKLKLEEIRSKRDVSLLENDKAWLIAKKKGEDTSDLEAQAQTLRDLPEVAELALANLESVEEIQAYDAFAE